MSKRVTLEDDEIELIDKLLKRAIGQRSAMSLDLSILAEVTYDRLALKLKLPRREPAEKE